MSYAPLSIHFFASRLRQAAFSKTWSSRLDDSISDEISSVLSSTPNGINGDTAGVCGWAFTIAILVRQQCIWFGRYHPWNYSSR